jgi:protein SCO1
MSLSVPDTEFGPVVHPIFITCDPARDTVEQTKAYVKGMLVNFACCVQPLMACSDFHPRLIGLTGSYEAIKAACKAYRVYFSTPPNTKPGDDYLVDHSIFFYLMNPAGEFVDAYGKSQAPEMVRTKVAEAIHKWKQ